MEIEREDSEEIQEVFTCGVCEEIVDNVEAICSHPCIEGYPQMIIDDNRYFYPQCDNGDTVRRSDVNGETVNVVESPQFSSNHIPQGESESNVDEILIAEVYLREPLWNQNLAIARRDRKTVDKLWQEVSEATKGVYSIEEAKRKWKNFRDRFMRIVSAEKLPSGAANQLKKKNKWRFYESLNFLRDTLLIKKTVSNTPVSNDNENIEDEEDKEEEPVQNSSKSSKKQKTSQDSVLLTQISEALREPQQTISLPSAPVMDEIDYFGMMICSQLRKFPEARSRQLMFKIHKMLHKEQSKDVQ